MRAWIAVAAICTAALLSATAVEGQSPAPAPPTNLTATDHRWDNGTRIDLAWTLSSDDAALQGYAIRKKAAGDAAFSRVALAPPGTRQFVVTDLDPRQSHLFEVAAVAKDNAESSPAATSAPVTPTIDWFDGTRIWFLVTLVMFCGSVIAFIAMARKGAPLKIRQIAGLKAVDAAVGRATEMGRSCLFVPGITGGSRHIRTRTSDCQ